MDTLDNLAEDLKLLGDKTRLTILTLLKEREWCVCEFVDLFDISQPAVSQHLRKLKSSGLVKEQKRGQWVYYSLNIEDKPHVKAILNLTPDASGILLHLNKPSKTACCE
ncbi:MULTISPECIES: metalloregulator ArsR/SmtB family transcription factor [unclassified Paenibacillus]|uniref:ArsR/SmtB family transcription factor n=1 Tax=unclassified Paenibacillus TaxID=185978 RepID=UPI0003E2301F|nr:MULTISPECIES: metalloregulator ArsR/SmtB family transcription factor [unclassified Paenibacillus]ETT46391.1 ArsR family transcriptional regulator [Paenibacillus sp. FSL R7-269]OMF84741.1 transcriptional regulator [Paenibacillus sp. FSL R7-0337]